MKRILNSDLFVNNFSEMKEKVNEYIKEEKIIEKNWGNSCFWWSVKNSIAGKLLHKSISHW